GPGPEDLRHARPGRAPPPREPRLLRPLLLRQRAARTAGADRLRRRERVPGGIRRGEDGAGRNADGRGRVGSVAEGRDGGEAGEGPKRGGAPPRAATGGVASVRARAARGWARGGA